MTEQTPPLTSHSKEEPKFRNRLALTMALAYRASRDIAQEKTKEDVLEVTSRILNDAPFVTVTFTTQGKGTGISSASDPDYDISKFSLPSSIDTSLKSIVEEIKSENGIIDLDTTTPFPKAFIDVPKNWLSGNFLIAHQSR